MKLNNKEYEEKMKKSISVYEHEISTIRAGRANPAVLDKISVDYYGTPTQINQMAQISMTDARTMVIQPWDASTLKTIDRAIQASDLGITPNNDGKVLRIAFPPLTEDRRKELVKQITKMSEEAKVAVRNIRREANDKCKDMKKKSEMTEDEQKQSEKSIQDVTDKFIKDIDVITATKEKEIMTV
ncbi:MAG: ribosome recycling factor [Eubacteriales bacterium]